jgi:sRNA-binding carbon storage regulator CsrA
MLVLSRNQGEVVVLRLPDGREVRVCLVAFGHNGRGKPKARLGFDAPADVVIAREELLGRAKGEAGGP